MNFDQTYCSGSRCPKRKDCVHFIGHVSEWAMENNKGYIEGPLNIVERSPAEGGSCFQFAEIPEQTVDAMLTERHKRFDVEHGLRAAGVAAVVEEIDEFMERIAGWRPTL